MRTLFPILLVLAVFPLRAFADETPAAPAFQSPSSIPDRPIARSERMPPETLIHDGFESSGYGAPVVKYSRVAGTDAFFVGGKGGWVINHSFVLGGAGYGLVSNYQLPGDVLSFGYGGAMLEYIADPDRLIHLSFDTVIGGGGVGPKHNSSPNAVFILEPEANVLVNISQGIHAGLGVSYRFTRGVHIADLTNSDLSGFGSSLFVQFGGF
jgi:hypothetical protein